MNKKLKRILIIFLLFMVLIYTKSIADVYNAKNGEETSNFDSMKPGDTVSNVNFNNSLFWSNPSCGEVKYYCVERSQDLNVIKSKGVTYSVEHVINLVGKKATMDGEEYESPAIGRMAYILSKNEGYQDGTMWANAQEYYFHNGSDGNKHYTHEADKQGTSFTTTQKLIWLYVNEFANKMGIELNGDANSRDENFQGTVPESDAQQLGMYWNNLKNEREEVESHENDYLDKTEGKINNDNAKIFTSTYPNDSTPYIEYGPLKVSVSNVGRHMELKDQKDMSIDSGVSYYVYENGEKKWIQGSEIPTGRDFYIRFQATDQVLNMSKLKIEIVPDKQTVKTARVVIMSNNDHQRLFLVKVDEASWQSSAKKEVDVNLKGTLKIIKQDAKEPHTRLPGVQFKIKKGSQYLLINKNNPSEKTFYDIDAWERDFEIQADGSNQYGWTNIFTTDSNGEITIENVLTGTYYAEEIGYTEESGLSEWYNINENKNRKKIKVIVNDMYLPQQDPEVLNSAEFWTESLASYGKMKITYKAPNGEMQKLLTYVGDGVEDNVYDDTPYFNTNEEKTGSVRYVGTSYFNEHENDLKKEGWTDVFTANSNGWLKITTVAGGSYKIDTLGIVDNIHRWGNLNIYKRDSKTNEKLPGVQFKIYRIKDDGNKQYMNCDLSNNNVNDRANLNWTNDENSAYTYTTDNNGEITIYNIPVGTYYAEEIGYTEESGLSEWYNINENKNTKEIKVIVNDMYLPGEGDVATFETKSLSPYGKVKITYTTSSGEMQKLLTYVGNGEDHNGSYFNTSEYKIGSVIYRPLDYVESGWTDVFTADSNGKLTITTVAGGSYKIDTLGIVNNIQSWGNLNIYKRDSKTNEKLPGVQFKIYRIKDGNKQYMNCDLNNNNVNDRANLNWTNDENSAYTYTTDNNGEITIYNIPVGTYYAEEIGYTEESGLSEWYNINENKNTKEIKVIKNDMYFPQQDPNVLNSALFWTDSSSSYGKMKITYTQDGKNEKLLTYVGDGVEDSIYDHDSYFNANRDVKEERSVIYVGTSYFNEHENDLKKEGWTDIFTANSNGQLLITNVAGGSYKIDTLGIVYNNQTYTDFELIKIDETTKERLKGVTFELVYKSAFEDQILINYVGPNNINNSIYTRLKDNTENYNIGDVKYIGLNDWNRDKATWEANGWTSSFITDSNGTIKINNINVGIYDITETYNPSPYYDSHPNTTEKVNVEANAEHSYTYTVKNPQKYIDLMIPKIDEDTGKGIKGVEFEVKYVNAEGKIEYVLRNVNTDELMYCGEEDWKKNTIQDDGTNGYGWTSRFPTNEDGIVYIKYLTLGEYTVVEVYNPDPHYETYPNIGKRVTLTPNKNHVIECATFVNKRTHVDISGYVWLDAFSGKESIKNDLYYQTDIFRVQDEDERKVIQDRGLDGVTVRLIDSRTGKVVQGKGTVNGNKNMLQTKTSEQGIYPEIQGGEYKFNLVMISQLQYYYVQFEYDGLIYQSVIPHIDTNNGSKASDELSRKDLDKKFDVVYSKGKNEVKFNEGKETIYYNETVEHKTSIKDSTACILTANTTDAGYTITYGEQDYENGTTEIRYINLGLYEKPQADLAVKHELDNVNVKVNGYEHIYKDTNTREPGYDAWNVGVKFKNDYTGTYKRAIYKADAEYISQDESKKLQVYLTYKIAVRNQSSYLTKVNSIVDYFDNNYTFVAAGTGIGDQNEITGALGASEDESYNDDNYKKVTIETNIEVGSEDQYIYVQFKVGRQTVLDMINSQEEELLYNIAEINSYTVYKDDNKNTVAAVDKDSVPGNAKASEVNTYEDDTEAAPPVWIVLQNARKIQGTVFLDSTSGELKTGEVREGNGIYDNDEETIAEVKVVLHELNNSISDKEVITDANGNYSFDEFIPGQYTITYIWGDKTYKVQDYKGTIYDSFRNQKNIKWYSEDVDTRKTDAIDNYDTRERIDEQVKTINNKTVTIIEEAYEKGYSGDIINKMDSATPTMEFGVEYDTTITDGTGNRVEFIVKNVDFGIVERAKQELDMTKRVSTFKITLANGQTLVDATVKKDGTLEGTTNHVTYMGPSSSNGNEDNGFIKAEVDSELIQGATLEIGYEIIAKNNSELDYKTKEFYVYGTQAETYKDIVTLTPTTIVDYLDENLVYNNSDNKWEQISKEDLNNLSVPNISDKLLNTKISIKAKSDVLIKPGEEKSVVELKVSKLLASSENITFDNKAEIVEITTTGRRVEKFPEAKDSETVSITPSTGENRDYQTIIIISVISLICLTLGIVLIKKKAL